MIWYAMMMYGAHLPRVEGESSDSKWSGYSSIACASSIPALMPALRLSWLMVDQSSHSLRFGARVRATLTSSLSACGAMESALHTAESDEVFARSSFMATASKPHRQREGRSRLTASTAPQVQVSPWTRTTCLGQCSSLLAR